MIYGIYLIKLSFAKSFPSTLHNSRDRAKRALAYDSYHLELTIFGPSNCRIILQNSFINCEKDAAVPDLRYDVSSLQVNLFSVGASKRI